MYFAGGKEPQDMAMAVKIIADGRIDIGSWIGSKIGLNGVAAALADMSGPDAAIRIVVDPRRF